MLSRIWCVAGHLLGIFVRRRSVVLLLAAVVWVISMTTIAGRTIYSLQMDGDAVGVLARLAAATLACSAGAIVRDQGPVDASRNGA